MARNQTKKKCRYLSKKRNKFTRCRLYGGVPPKKDTVGSAASIPDASKLAVSKSLKSISDREQTTDFIFYNPELNPQNGYVKYIVVNQSPEYLNIFDNLSYQFMDMEEMLHALSQNKKQIPAYVIHKTIKTSKARSESEIGSENEKLKTKQDKLQKKYDLLETMKR